MDMKKDIYSNINTKSIKIVLPVEDADYIAAQAKRQNVSQRKYIQTKLLDTTVGIRELKDTMMQKMPGYYRLVQQVEDSSLRQELLDMGGALCRCLK